MSTVVSEPRLAVSGLSLAYGAAGLALRDVSLELGDGIVAVLGANGAGKSTLARALTGTHRYHNGRIVGGSIRLGDAEITRERPSAIVRRGIALVPEGRQVIGQLSVEDNLRAGAIGAGFRIHDESALETTFDLFGVLKERRKQPAGYLSGGEQQMLAIGRALAARPDILVLDEPTLGLAPKVIRTIAEVIAELNRRGMAVLLIEQNASMALGLAETAYVMNLGEVVAHGTAEEIASGGAAAEVYLGGGGAGGFDSARSDAERPRRAVSTSSTPLLDLEGVSVSFGEVHAVQGVDLTVNAGELVGLIGPNGAGKSSLLNAVTSAYDYTGTIRLNGADLRGMGRARIARLGVARSFQHAPAPPGARVLDMVMLGRERLMHRGFLAAGLRLNRREEARHRAVAQDLLDRLGLGELADEPIGTCSYGAQKRIDFARALALEPELLLLDEPFAGVHASEAELIMAMLRELMEERQLGVLLIDHNVGALLGAADRVAVLDFGRKIADASPEEIRQDPRVLRAYLGAAPDGDGDGDGEALGGPRPSAATPEAHR